MSRILITTDYLKPGDPVDVYLREHGHETVHAPLRGRRDRDELVGLLDGVDGALIANEPMTAGVLASAPALKVVVRSGVGYDSVDVAAASELGILVSNLPGINANAVAEFTMGAILREDVASGRCGRSPRCGCDRHGSDPPWRRPGRRDGHPEDQKSRLPDSGGGS